MIILDTTTRSLEIDLNGAVTTNQLPFVASYVDVNQSTFAVSAMATNTGASNNTTAVTLVAAPGATTSRVLKHLSIKNSDTVAALLWVQMNDNSTLREIWKGTLAVGDSLIYTDAAGWTVLNSSGQVKTGSGISSIGASTDNALVRWDGTGGTAIQNSGWTLDDSNVLTAGSHLALGANYISRAGTAAGFSLDASNNATLSAALAVADSVTISKSQNSQFIGVQVSNATSGTAAISTINLVAGSNTSHIYNFSQGYSTSAQYVASSMLIENDSAAGLSLSCSSTGPVKIWNLGVLTATFNSSNNTILSGTLTVNGTGTNTFLASLTRFTPSAGENVDLARDGSGPYMGTSSNHAYSIITNNTRAITISTAQAVTLAGTLTVSGATITTGSTTALSLATSGGEVGRFVDTASAVNYLSFTGSASGAGNTFITSSGTDSNISLSLQAKGTSSVLLYTGGGIQAAVLNTASASNYVTLTGSNGGNPTIGVSGGNLVLSATATLFGATNGNIEPTNGYLVIGATASTLYLDAAASGNIVFRPNGSTQTGYISGTAGASILTTGLRIGADSTNNLIDDASNGAGTATLYIGNASINVTSDENVKSNITPLEDGLSIINALQPIEFDQDEERPWGDQRHYMGFGARHSHKVAPWAVHTQGDTGLPWKMRQEFLMAPTVRAVQQIDERLKALEARLQ